MKLALFLLASASLVACSTVVPTTYTPTANNFFPERAEGCSFRVFTTNPDVRFKEIGMVDMDRNVFAEPSMKTVAGAKKVVAPFVCKAGGDAVLLWEANGHGEYIKAVIIKTEQ